MKALARALATAAALAALSVVAAVSAHATSPQVDHGTVDQQSTQDRHGKVWRCNSGHGPQFDCADAASLTGSQSSPDPATPAPAGRGSPLAPVRSLALLGLLVALATGGDWLRRHHRPRAAT